MPAVSILSVLGMLLTAAAAAKSKADFLRQYGGLRVPLGSPWDLATHGRGSEERDVRNSHATPAGFIPF